MGTEMSSCCGGSGDRDSQLELNNGAGIPRELNGTGANITKCGPLNLDNNTPSTTAEEVEEFRKKFYTGIDVNLILQDKSRLVCQVQLDPSQGFLLLSCDSDALLRTLLLQKKVRAIKLTDIKGILHTRAELERVESSAGICDVDTCAAIHLAASGNCIPLFFTNPKDKTLFIEVVEQVRASMTP